MVGWYLLNYIAGSNIVATCVYVPNGFQNCIDYEYLNPFPPICHVTCTPLSTIFLQYIFYFFIPFFGTYFLLSLIENDKVKNK